MGEGVAGRGGGAPDGRKRPAAKPQRVTNVVETDTVGKLSVEHGDHVAPCREGSTEGLNAIFPGELGNHVVGNKVAKLPQDNHTAFRTTGLGVFVFHPLPGGRIPGPRPLFLSKNQPVLWDACDFSNRLAPPMLLVGSCAHF